VGEVAGEGDEMKRLLRPLIPIVMLAAAFAVIATRPHNTKCKPLEIGGIYHPSINCARCHQTSAPVIHQSPFPNRMVASD
jgi:hypothetical protein